MRYQIVKRISKIAYVCTSRIIPNLCIVMKHVRHSLLLLLLISFLLPVQSQTLLSDSRQNSEEIHVYKLNKDDLRKLYLKNKTPGEDMLHTYIGKYKREERGFLFSLPRGNYLTVGTNEHELVYDDYTVDNLFFSVVPDEDVMLCLYDSLGNYVKDAEVRKGSHKLKFDPHANVYVTSKVKDEQIVEVNNNGVYHYIEFSKENDYNYRNRNGLWNRAKWKMQRFWNNIKWGVAGWFGSDKGPGINKYNGFVVFSKPKYKPGETVKMKAYIAYNNGKPYNDPAEVALKSYYPKMDTVLTVLAPYRPGMYEYEFKLTDSLKLYLDKSYYIEFKTKGKRTNNIEDSFAYEEYELKGINFTAKTQQEKYVKGDTIKLNLKATDENEMAVYDGRATILVTPSSSRHENKYHTPNVFVPDTLWHHEVDMSSSAEKEIIVPDSVFPCNISQSYNIKYVFLNAENEKHEAKNSFHYDTRGYKIDISVAKGIMTIRELHKGISQPARALLTTWSDGSDIISQDSVTLPYTFPMPWYVHSYDISTGRAKGSFYVEDDLEKGILTHQFYRSNDSIKLVVDSPSGNPFWYTIRKKNKIIAKGSATSLNYGTPDKGEEGYAMQISYFMGSKQYFVNGTLPFIRKNISMEVSTPTVVYPGQTAEVNVSVTDKKGKPVKNADITAYAFTTKFGAHQPKLTIYGLGNHGRGFNPGRYTVDEIFIPVKNRKIPMDWEIWRERMNLAGIEYYKFLYPTPLYTYSEPAKEGITQIAPYVVINGEVQAVHVLWIDEQPYYLEQARQHKVYSFPVTPGRHTIRMRTFDREVTLWQMDAVEGKKTIFSVDGDPENSSHLSNITITKFKKKEKGKLTDQELSTLRNYMITVDREFGNYYFPGGNIFGRSAWFDTGTNAYYITQGGPKHQRYNYRPAVSVNSPLLIGPFPYEIRTGKKNIATLYTDSVFISNIEIEGGNRYTIYNNFLKMKTWEDKNLINRGLSKFSPSVNLKQNVLTKEDIYRMSQQEIYDRLKRLSGPLTNVDKENELLGNNCRVSIILNKSIDVYFGRKPIIDPVLVLFTTDNPADTLKYVYYGNTREFDRMPAGRMNCTLVFGDSTVYSHPLVVQPRGINYLAIDSVAPTRCDTLFNYAFDVLYKHTYSTIPSTMFYQTPYELSDSIVNVQAEAVGKYNASNALGNVITGTVYDETGEPVIGASVTVAGTTNGTITDIDGRFTLRTPGIGKLRVLYIGYNTVETDIVAGFDYSITMNADHQMLDEIIVVGYGTVKKTLAGSVSQVTTNESFYLDAYQLQGKLSGLTTTYSSMRIRGSSADGVPPPLIIVNGLPYEGSLSNLKASDIASVNTLKDASATAIYGSRAAGGVIFIETKSLSDTNRTEDEGENDASDGPANSLRRNFHDDAFWQPRLATDSDGKVSFKVTYPDDITSWNANFIAVGKKKQTDKTQLVIKSFKALTARLSTPRFAIRGDSLSVTGKLANHLGDTVSVKRAIQINGAAADEKQISLAKSYVDNIPVVAAEGDSLKVTYTLQRENGYFDGEERSLPIFEKGMLETHGEFLVINDTATRQLTPPGLPGKVTLHAEASGLELFMREIEKVDRYPYLCNEQMASKIKSLLTKKKIAKLFNLRFKDERNIRNLVNRLNRNQNADKLWGWWNQSSTEFWISAQVIEAMLEADKEGYVTNFQWSEVADKLLPEVNRVLSANSVSLFDTDPFAKRNILRRLTLLRSLNASIDYEGYYKALSNLKDHSLTDKLLMMEYLIAIDRKQEVNRDTLMHYAQKTIMGSMYWGEKEEPGSMARHFMLPYRNNVEPTLVAYRILRSLGGYDKEMEQTRNYFFELRKDGSWRNTYESSRIMETIMPDMLKEGETFAEVQLNINGKQITKFPYTEEQIIPQPVTVRKTGTLPVFFTLYQEHWNENPQPTSKGFDVQTVFKENKDTVSILHAGKVAELEVTVKLDSEAQYIQIEVPIPAGCSYESKTRGNFMKEAHREYFKEKVSIFCNRLDKGVHHFTIKLIPRYTGHYQINPAKAELMYFPTFYGNNEMKDIGIE